MSIVVSEVLKIDAGVFRDLSAQSFRDLLGLPSQEEKIPLHGGGMRIREQWLDRGVTLLRDDEEKKAVCVMIESGRGEIIFDHEVVPDRESVFAREFPAAERVSAHTYRIVVGPWLVHLDFARPLKKRGVGSSVYLLKRITIGKKDRANQTPVPMPESRPFSNRRPVSGTAHL